MAHAGMTTYMAQEFIGGYIEVGRHRLASISRNKM
jgi:hypothetical protein